MVFQCQRLTILSIRSENSTVYLWCPMAYGEGTDNPGGAGGVGRSDLMTKRRWVVFKAR